MRMLVGSLTLLGALALGFSACSNWTSLSSCANGACGPDAGPDLSASVMDMAGPSTDLAIPDAASPCVGDAHDFCDDFERTTNVRGHWDSVNGDTPGSTVTITDGTLVATDPPDGGAASIGAYLLKGDNAWSQVQQPDAGAPLFDYRFKMKVNDCGDMNVTPVFRVILDGSESFLGFLDVVVSNDAGSCVVHLHETYWADGSLQPDSTTQQFTSGEWLDLHVSLQEDAPFLFHSYLTVNDDPTTTVDLPPKMPHESMNQQSTPYFSIAFGLPTNYSGPASQQVELDNFVLDYRH